MSDGSRNLREMAVYQLGELTPRIDPDAFVHPEAVIIGDVTVGPESTIWPCAILRGDHGAIRIGARTSVQDGAVIHAGPGFPTIVDDDCVIGHLAHLEGCHLKSGSLVGSSSVVLQLVVVESGATIGANALVRMHTTVPAGALAVGVPAEIKVGGSNLEMIRVAAEEYVESCHQYRKELRRID